MSKYSLPQVFKARIDSETHADCDTLYTTVTCPSKGLRFSDRGLAGHISCI